jgi:hypothetical protein
MKCSLSNERFEKADAWWHREITLPCSIEVLVLVHTAFKILSTQSGWRCLGLTKQFLLGSASIQAVKVLLIPSQIAHPLVPRKIKGERIYSHLVELQLFRMLWYNEQVLGWESDVVPGLE